MHERNRGLRGGPCSRRLDRPRSFLAHRGTTSASGSSGHTHARVGVDPGTTTRDADEVVRPHRVGAAGNRANPPSRAACLARAGNDSGVVTKDARVTRTRVLGSAEATTGVTRGLRATVRLIGAVGVSGLPEGHTVRTRRRRPLGKSRGPQGAQYGCSPRNSSGRAQTLDHAPTRNPVLNLPFYIIHGQTSCSERRPKHGLSSGCGHHPSPVILTTVFGGSHRRQRVSSEWNNVRKTDMDCRP
jgi:hypothetical protein